MKRLLIAVSLFAILGPTTDSFGNDPSMAGPTTANQGSSQGKSTINRRGRRKFVKRRMKQLDQMRKDHKQGQLLADFHDAATGAGTTRNLRNERQAMIHRFEYLALKKEHKGLSYAEQAEMRALMFGLLGR